MIDAIEAGDVNARITGLISNKPGVGALDRAKKKGIATKVLMPSAYDDKKVYESDLLETLKNWTPDLIVLAGYLQKIPESVIKKYEGQIINIHPSLLPKYGGKGFYGLKVHQAVIEAGESKSGCSVHRVTEVYDDGPVIDSRAVPVKPTDTPEELAQRILEEEHKLLPKVINQLLTNQTT